jgi:hypothetical protein
MLPATISRKPGAPRKLIVLVDGEAAAAWKAPLRWRQAYSKTAP